MAIVFSVVMYFLNQGLTEELQPKRAAQIVENWATNHSVKVKKPNGASGVTGSAIVYKTNQFRWNQIESADYREYIKNLRSVGCPEATIRDIIITDIMRLYAARRGQFYHNGKPFKFWETDEKRKPKAKQLEEREK